MRVISINSPNKFFYTLLIHYDGTNFFGWQRQPTLPTVQQTIVDTINKLHQTEVNLIGASRTDARVHALGQVAQLISPIELQTKNLCTILNHHLPPSIRIQQIVKSNRNFMVIYDVIKKDYYYLFSNTPNLVTPQKHIVNFEEPLDLQKMLIAQKNLIGTHSFHNFQYRMNKKNSPIRTLTDVNIIKNPSYAPKVPYDVYSLEITGTGFLKQMVRIIIGTMINIGLEIHQPEDIYSALHPESVDKLGFIAPADGLHLSKIYYSKDPFARPLT